MAISEMKREQGFSIKGIHRMKHIDDEMNLLEMITAKRAIMTALWNERGHTDAEVLEISIQLDHLLNQYQRLVMGKKEIEKRANIV